MEADHAPEEARHDDGNHGQNGAKGVKGVDPRVQMNRAWENVPNMTLGAAVAAVWTVKSIEYIEVAKFVPEFTQTVEVGELRPGEPLPAADSDANPCPVVQPRRRVPDGNRGLAD